MNNIYPIMTNLYILGALLVIAILLLALFIKKQQWDTVLVLMFLWSLLFMEINTILYIIMAIVLLIMGYLAFFHNPHH